MKKSLRDMVANADATKKVNPQDLSSDQDLTIGIMNLIAIENVAGGSQIAQMVADVRKTLMGRLVRDSENMEMSYDLLGQSAQLFQDGLRALPNKAKAYKYFDASYQAYVLFWGLNMGFITANEIEK